MTWVVIYLGGEQQKCYNGGKVPSQIVVNTNSKGDEGNRNS